MRFCFDIDGVIAEIRQPHQAYSEVRVISGAREYLRQLRSEGHIVILNTARHMKTTNGNVAKVIAKEGKNLLDWLEKHDIEYDEILFGKPWADVYVDDNAIRFSSWSELSSEDIFMNRNLSQE